MASAPSVAPPLDISVLPAIELPQEITRRSLTIPIAWDVMLIKAEPGPEFDFYTAKACAPETRLRVASDVRYRREQVGSLVQRGVYTRAFNKTASLIFEAFSETRSVEDIGRLVAQHSGVEFSPALGEAVARFLESARLKGLLEQPEDDAPSAARFYFIDDDVELGEGVFAMPTTMEFEITNKCYRHCSYCAYESGPNPKINQDRELSTAQWIEIIDQVEAEGVVGLEFTGGDPFVRDDALELMQYADSKGMFLTINSDLSILNPNHLSGLTELRNLFAVQTSLDGASPETCDLTRGKGGFKTLMKQLTVLRDAGFPVAVGTTVHRRNYTEIRAIAELAADAGASGMYIGPMYPAGRGASMKSWVVEPEQWDIAVEQYAGAVREGVIAATDVKWDELASDATTGTNPVANQVHITSRGDRSLRIDPTGNAYVSAKLRQWHPRFWTVGSVAEFDLRTIWRQSKLLNELRSYPVRLNPFNGLDVRDIHADVNARPDHEDEATLTAASV